jgi:tRNA A-37 threonylcarbamoyl transferase component Bud32
VKFDKLEELESCEIFARIEGSCLKEEKLDLAEAHEELLVENDHSAAMPAELSAQHWKSGDGSAIAQSDKLAMADAVEKTEKMETTAKRKSHTPTPLQELVQSIAKSIIAICVVFYISALVSAPTLFSIQVPLTLIFLVPALVAARWPIRLAQQINKSSGKTLIQFSSRARFAAVHPLPIFMALTTNFLILANFVSWDLREKLLPLAAIFMVTLLLVHGIMYLEWQFRFFNRFQELMKGAQSDSQILSKPNFVPTMVFITIMLSIGAILANPLCIFVLFFLQAVAYTKIANRLKEVGTEVLVLERQESKGSQIQEPETKPTDLLLPYSSFAELERWYKQRFSLRSPWKLVFVSVIATILFTMNVPATILFFATRLVIDGVGGGQGATGLAHTQQNFSLAFIASTLMLFLLSAAAALIVLVRRPRGLAIGESGLRFVYSPLSGRKDNYLAWSDITSIEIARPAGKTSTFDDWIIFHSNRQNSVQSESQATSPKSGPTTIQTIGPASIQAPLKIRIGSLPNYDDKEKLLAAIERYAPQVSRDAKLTEALQRPADQSYTELWLQALSAPPQREKLKPLEAGATLKNDRYRVLRQLGVGGQGFAYLAQDSTTQEELVLKEFVLPIYVDVTARKQALERFEKEARLLAELDHAQVVKLAGFFVEDHRAYLVLEHIDGDNLRSIIEQRGPLPDSEIRALALQMAEILKYLHGLSPPLVHRDFTPDNLILGKDGKLKLIDFNVAQQIETATTGTVVGKQAYLPPEQFRGQATTASDLYAMGATLYCLATGRDPVPISQSKPSADGLIVSEPLDKLISDLTDIDETARPKSAQSVLEIIQSWN